MSLLLEICFLVTHPEPHELYSCIYLVGTLGLSDVNSRSG